METGECEVNYKLNAGIIEVGLGFDDYEGALLPVTAPGFTVVCGKVPSRRGELFILASMYSECLGNDFGSKLFGFLVLLCYMGTKAHLGHE